MQPHHHPRIPPPTRRAVAACILGATLLWCGSAQGHNGPPAGLGIAAERDGQPTVVRLSEGMAIWRGSHWRFLCPANWGSSPESPLATSEDASEVWIPGDGSMFTVSEPGVPTPVGGDELEAVNVRQLLGGPQGVLALRSSSSQTELWQLGEGTSELWWSSGERWSSIARTEDAVWLAETRSGQLELLELDLASGAERQRRTLLSDRQLQTPSLRVAGGSLFVAMNAPGVYELLRLDPAGPVSLAESEAAIHGPVEAGGEVLSAVAGNLVRHDGDALVLVDDSLPIFCLEQLGGLVYACSYPDMYEVGPAGLGERIFDLERLHPPDLELVPDTKRGICTFEWLRISGDLGRQPFPYPSGLKEGCSLRGNGPRSPAALLLALVLLWPILARRRS